MVSTKNVETMKELAMSVCREILEGGSKMKEVGRLRPIRAKDGAVFF